MNDVLDKYVRPIAESSALILIDVQHDFYDDAGAARIPGTAEAIPVMADLAAAFREAGRPIIHVIRLYKSDGANVDPVRRTVVEQGARIVAPGSPGSQIAPALLPIAVQLDPEFLLAGGLQPVSPYEHIMYKPRWGAFYDTELEAHLRSIGVDTLVFGGCNFPNCPRTSMYEASERDFRVVLVADAMSGVYERGAQECQRIGIAVQDLEQTVDWLGVR